MSRDLFYGCDVLILSLKIQEIWQLNAIFQTQSRALLFCRFLCIIKKRILTTFETLETSWNFLKLSDCKMESVSESYFDGKNNTNALHQVLEKLCKIGLGPTFMTEFFNTRFVETELPAETSLPQICLILPILLLYHHGKSQHT